MVVWSECDTQACENTDWIDGVRGTCNNVTNECECAEGYSGRFVLNPYNACFISDAQKWGLVITMVAVSAVCSLVSFISAIKKIYVYKEAKMEMSNQRTSERKVTRRNQRRRRTIFYLQAGFLVVELVHLLFGLLLLEDPNRLNYGYAIGLPSGLTIIIGVVGSLVFTISLVLFKLYYETIPTPIRLAAKVGIKTFLTRHPKCKFSPCI